MKLTEHNIKEFVDAHLADNQRVLDLIEGEDNSRGAKYATKCAGLRRLLIACFEEDGVKEVDKQLMQTQVRLNRIMAKGEQEEEGFPKVIHCELDDMDTRGIDVMDMHNWFEKAYDYAYEMSQEDKKLSFNDHLSGIVTMICLAYDNSFNKFEIPGKSLKLFAKGGLIYDGRTYKEVGKPTVIE